MPYDESDDYDVYEIIDQAYNEADRMSRPIHLLLETYQKYEEHDPDADRVADDSEALEWLDDYWEYVKWNEHGNESSIDEVGGFKGFARTVTDSDYVEATLNYLIYEDDPELIDPTARDLADRLKNIASRYGTLRKMKKSKEFWEREDCFDELTPDMQDKVRDLCMTLQVNDPIIEKRDDGYYFLFSYYDGDPEYYFDKYDIQQDKEGKFNYFKLDKMKKSQDIHSMIADIRKNNNSLKKEPVGLNGNWAVSYFAVPTEHGEYLNMMQSNYFSNDVVACYEGTITAYPTSTGTNDLYAQMTYNQDTGEINGYIEWGQYNKNYVPTNAHPKSKESLDVFIGEFKQFAEEFTQMIK